jgi:hypothetical protein
MLLRILAMCVLWPLPVGGAGFRQYRCVVLASLVASEETPPAPTVLLALVLDRSTWRAGARVDRCPLRL